MESEVGVAVIEQGVGLIGELWGVAEACLCRKVTGKRLGEMAEAAFVVKASGMGFSVAKPWGDSDPYDFITQAGERLCRVQVKSAHRKRKDGGYSLHTHGHSMQAYLRDEIDFLVAYLVPVDVWYVFPIEALLGRRSLKLFPSFRQKRSKYEKYREAWDLMRGRNGRSESVGLRARSAAV
jgi:hypothetical protein